MTFFPKEFFMYTIEFYLAERHIADVMGGALPNAPTVPDRRRGRGASVRRSAASGIRVVGLHLLAVSRRLDGPVARGRADIEVDAAC